MRLTRVAGPPAPSSYLVADVSAPSVAVAPPVDYQASFGREYERLYAPLVTYAERYVSREEARDAVGDAMESIWRRWPEVVREKRNDTYFFSAVHYAVFARIEANSKLVSIEDVTEELDQVAFDAEPRTMRGQTRREIVEEALAAMPAKRRAVILLLKEQDLTYPEAAKVLGLSIGTINSHARLAFADLRAALTSAGFQLPAAHTPRLSAPKGDDSND